MNQYSNKKPESLMQEYLMVLVSDYTSKDLKEREKTTLSSQKQTELCVKARELLPVDDFFVIATCNRTEIYFTPIDDAARQIVALIHLVKGDDNIKIEDFEVIDDGKQACKRLFEVAIGVRSRILGDIQVINQIKDAYQRACDAGSIGPFLHRVMHTIFYTHKQVVTSTAFKSGQVSIASAVTEKIRKRLQIHKEAPVLVIGAGDVGRKVIDNLLSSGYTSITIINRTYTKAKAIANEKQIDWQHLEKGLVNICQFNVIVSAVNVEEELINEKQFKQLRSFSHVFDLSVPRSISVKAENYDGVFLWNIDKLQEESNETLQKRKAALPRVNAIIEKNLEELEEWSSQLEIKPVIHKFKALLNNIKQQEIEKCLKNLDSEQVKAIEEVTDCINKKIMKYPVLHLKNTCQRNAENKSSIQALSDLFDLENADLQIKNTANIK